MTWKEYMRFKGVYPIFYDTNEQLHIVIDGLDILVTPSSEEWNDHKEEINSATGISTTE